MHCCHGDRPSPLLNRRDLHPFFFPRSGTVSKNIIAMRVYAAYNEDTVRMDTGLSIIVMRLYAAYNEDTVRMDTGLST